MLLLCDHRGSGLSKALAPLRRAGFELETARSLRESLERLAARRYELVILDPLAPGGSVELGELVRRCEEAPPTPLLLVTDPGDPRALVEAAAGLEAGPCDLVRRDASAEEFELRARRLIERAGQLDELLDLRYRAAHDDLTDLVRPLTFQARLEEHFSAAERHGLDLSLVLIDLDDFGLINKRFDHTVGDRVLAGVARVIRESLRAEDVAGRLGGDEFGICLPFTGALEAAATVRRLGRMIAGLSGRLDGRGEELRITASLGFETTDGRQVASVQELRQRAETALRRAKRAGGDRGVFYRSGA